MGLMKLSCFLAFCLCTQVLDADINAFHRAAVCRAEDRYEEAQSLYRKVISGRETYREAAAVRASGPWSPEAGDAWIDPTQVLYARVRSTLAVNVAVRSQAPHCRPEGCPPE
jgi:hypothetical protein